MRQIRRSVFETNSSSSHSISIRKAGGYYTQEEIEDSVYQCKWDDWGGVLHFWDSELEFERSPFEPLPGFLDKVKFAIASLAEYDEEALKEIEAILYEFVPGLKTIKYPTHRDWKTDKITSYYGNIDHQSSGLLKTFLQTHNVSLRDFILDKRYVVFIDGDEYCIKEKLFDSGLINKDDFEEV